MNRESDKKRIRQRANRNRRALLKEKDKYGSYDDSGGKRYRIGVDYLASGDVEKAIEYYRWFEREFSDDGGEPIFLLYWALAEYRAGNSSEAQRRLMLAMISNPYMLPRIAGQPQERYDIWHFSNWREPEYLDRVVDYLEEPTAEEKKWIWRQYSSGAAQALLTQFLSVYKALQSERDITRRQELLDHWHEVKVKSCARRT